MGAKNGLDVLACIIRQKVRNKYGRYRLGIVERADTVLEATKENSDADSN